MRIEKRNERIYELRENGATFSYIGSLFNISKSRASQVYYRIKDRKECFDTWPPLKQILSVRSQRGLTDYFKDENILANPRKVAEVSAKDLLRTRNIGRKTIKEIVSALYKLGCIESAKDWLKSIKVVL